MGDAAISGLVNHVLEILASKAIAEIGLLWRIKVDVLTLRNSYNQIQDVLNDAEVKGREQKDVESWLKTLRSASLEAENVLDLVLIEAMLQKLHNERGTLCTVSAFFSHNGNPLMVRARMADKIKNVRRNLDEIAANKSKFNLISRPISVDAGVSGETTKMETTSIVNTSILCGRDTEKETVAKKICSDDIVGHDNIEGVRVFAIWGMGGVGKTTLAQLVYKDEDVRAHFDLQSWVYVSEDFQVKKITKEILESITKVQCQVSQLDTMQLALQDKLKEKRFLIVLDDVWIEDSNEWGELSKVLSCGAEGSIVMVTTRNQTTSRMMVRVSELQHEVECLSADESWLVFKELAFAPGSLEENVGEIECIGKEIVAKCKGLPLAVKTLGSLMWSKKGVRQWKSVRNSDLWKMQEPDKILPVLKLSYDNLLPHVKRCFAYCCLFPKGCEMWKDVLIELWMVNDFIPRRGEVGLYMIGEEIFYHLVSRSFIQIVQENPVEVVCKMHDLMHDLAQYVMRHDCWIVKTGKEKISLDEVLHLRSSCQDFSFLDQDSERLRALRSLLFSFVIHKIDHGVNRAFQHMYLRVLSLDGLNQPTLPESICELKHLRYLSLLRSRICYLPELIIYLQNLQVLIVRQCRLLRELPKGMRYMKNLRCLDNRECFRLDFMPIGIKELKSSLQRLGKFVVGEKEGARIGELGDVNLVGHGMELAELQNVEGLEEAKSAKLKEKRNLTYLALCWSLTLETEVENSEKVLEGLEPNSNLEMLDILNYNGKVIFPSWMMNLRNLVMIRFLCFKECERIPSLEKLPSLKVMTLYKMHNLECFDDDELPTLEELNIENCRMLKSLPRKLPKLTRLFILYI